MCVCAICICNIPRGGISCTYNTNSTTATTALLLYAIYVLCVSLALSSSIYAMYASGWRRGWLAHRFWQREKRDYCDTHTYTFQCLSVWVEGASRNSTTRNQQLLYIAMGTITPYVYFMRTYVCKLIYILNPMSRHSSLHVWIARTKLSEARRRIQNSIYLFTSI